MINKSINDVQVYTDIQDLAKINTEYLVNPDQAKTHVAEQFASLFLQLVMSSMRQANNVISSDLFDSQEMGLYQDLFDKQLSLTLASQNTGLVSMIKQNIDRQIPTTGAQDAVASPTPSTTTPAHTASAEEFVSMLWPAAQTAAKALHVDFLFKFFA